MGNEQWKNHSYISSSSLSSLYLEDWICLYDVHNVSRPREWPLKHGGKLLLIWNGRIRQGRTPWRDFAAIEGHYRGGDNADTWRAALTIESPTESFPRRMISFPWRLEALREAAYVPKVCIEAINARVKPVSRSSAILRYATFLGTPQRTSSLHSLSLSLSARFFHRYSWHKTLPRLRPFLAVVGNWVIRRLLEMCLLD